MKTFLLLLALISVVSAIGIALPAGTKDFQLPGNDGFQVAAFTRTLKNGQKQTWNLTGPNKGTWVDSKGKKVDSSNFTFKAPSSLQIKKVTKADEGFYDYTSSFVPPPPPKGVHVDPGMPSGIDISVN